MMLDRDCGIGVYICSLKTHLIIHEQNKGNHGCEGLYM